MKGNGLKHANLQTCKSINLQICKHANLQTYKSVGLWQSGYNASLLAQWSVTQQGTGVNPRSGILVSLRKKLYPTFSSPPSCKWVPVRVVIDM